MQFKKTIDSINEFSFNLNNISRLLANEYYTIKKTKKIQKKNLPLPEKKIADFFIPEEKDSIFWCWIIFLYGLGEYEILKQTVFTSEKTYKINFVEKLKKNKPLLKSLKIKYANIEGNLVIDSKILIENLEPLLLIDGYNFIYMNDSIYYENIKYPGKKVCVIKYFKNKDKYGIFLEEKDIFDYKSKLYSVDNFKKPIKSISSYKAQDLKDICKVLNINIMKTATKCKTKKELYQLIVETLSI